jgi:hypothetical protein
MRFTVTKKFTLQHDDGRREEFLPGEHDREPDIAKHWFVLAHTTKATTDALAVGTPQHAAHLKALTQKRYELFEEARKAYEESQAALDAREAEKAAPARRTVTAQEPIKPDPADAGKASEPEADRAEQSDPATKAVGGRKALPTAVTE